MEHSYWHSQFFCQILAGKSRPQFFFFFFWGHSIKCSYAICLANIKAEILMGRFFLIVFSKLLLANPGPVVVNKLHASKIATLIGESKIFLSVADAVRYVPKTEEPWMRGDQLTVPYCQYWRNSRKLIWFLVTSETLTLYLECRTRVISVSYLSCYVINFQKLLMFPCRIQTCTHVLTS